MKEIILNSKAESLPDEVETIGNLFDFLNLSREGTAVGINNKLILAKDWNSTSVNAGDNIVIISATYGG